MIKALYILLISLLLQIIVIVTAQSSSPRFEAKEIPGGINLEIDLSGGHKIYWLDSGDLGQPTIINLEGSENLESHLIIWPFPLQEMQESYLTNYYTGLLSIPVHMAAKTQNSKILANVKLNYILCKEQCVPVVQSFTVPVNVGNKQPNLSSFLIKDLIYQNAKLEGIAQFDNDCKDPKFMLDQKGENFVKSIASTKLNNKEYVISIAIDKSKYDKIKGRYFDVYSDQTHLPFQLEVPTSETRLQTLNKLLLMLLFAILGGFILNFMPCVLPVLSLKLISLTREQDNKKTASILTICGIISTFLILALVTIILKAWGKQFGLGANFQHPEFIILLMVILTIFVSSMLDKINFTLPDKFSNWLISRNFQNHHIEDFFSGVLSAILSTPCTAPFVGTAVAFSVSANNLVIIAVFFAIGFGFSLPYFALLLFPAIYKLMPKAGNWTITLKKILAILLIVTIFWLLSVLYAQIGMRPVVLTLMILVLIKFAVENIEKFWPKILLTVSLIVIALYLPKTAYQQKIEHKQKLDILWQEFDSDNLSRHVAAGKVVVVDITADWCVTCKFNKLMVWDLDKTISLLNGDDIVAMRGDYTKGDPEIYYFLAKHGTSSIPLNIVYGPGAPDGIFLPIIISYSDIKTAIKKAATKTNLKK